LELDEFDLVAILAEPEWANKIREGRFDEIAPYTRRALKFLL